MDEHVHLVMVMHPQKGVQATNAISPLHTRVVLQPFLNVFSCQKDQNGFVGSSA
jgi:hypothetical protein